MKKILIGIVLCVICCGTIYTKGKSDGARLMEDKLNSERLNWTAQIETQKKQFRTEVDKVQKEYLTKEHKLKAQIKSLKDNPKVITKYISVDDNTKLPYGLILWHDRLVMNTPLNQFLPDAVPLKDYTMYDLSNTLAYNYNTCNECMNKLTALQEIVKQYMEKQNKVIGERKNNESN